MAATRSEYGSTVVIIAASSSSFADSEVGYFMRHLGSRLLPTIKSLPIDADFLLRIETTADINYAGASGTSLRQLHRWAKVVG